jgi:hypothetical protein
MFQVEKWQEKQDTKDGGVQNYGVDPLSHKKIVSCLQEKSSEK